MITSSQDITEPPDACRTPEPEYSRLEASLKAQHMAHNFSEASSVSEDYGRLPAFLHRRHSSNYLTAVNSATSQKNKDKEISAETALPFKKENEVAVVEETQQSHEDTKRYLQRRSIDLENARSTDQFSVQYHGTRRDSTELKQEEADEKFLKKCPDHLKKYHLENSTKCEDPQCKKNSFCFHSNQMLSQDQVAIEPNYPESFEYNDFKRRMSFHS